MDFNEKTLSSETIYNGKVISTELLAGMIGAVLVILVNAAVLVNVNVTLSLALFVNVITLLGWALPIIYVKDALVGFTVTNALTACINNNTTIKYTNILVLIKHLIAE